MTSFADEFLYIDTDSLKKIIINVWIILGILCVNLCFFSWNISLPFILIGSVNYICTYLFINYSEICDDNVEILKMHLVFVIIHCILIISGEKSLLQKIFIFDIDSIIETSIYSSISINYILKSYMKESYVRKNEFIKYIVVMITISGINLYTNINDSFRVYGYRLIFILSVMIMFCNCLLLKEKKIKKDSNINIIKIVMIVILLIDVINIFAYNNYIVYSINLIRITCTNLFLIIYIYKLNIISNRIKFKKLNLRNEELEGLNRELIDKNTYLEVKRSKLIERNKLYNEFLKLVRIPIVIINRKNNRIIYSNYFFLDLCGKKLSRDIVNQNIGRLINFEGKISKEINDGEKGHMLATVDSEHETRILNVDYISLNEFEVVLMFNDITERKSIDNIKVKLEGKKIDEKMKNSFLSNISHDLKTPIGVIYSAIQLEEVYMDSDNEEYIEKYNNVCKDNCFYLTRLTNNLLDISRINENTLKANIVKDNIVYFIEDKVSYIIDYAKLNDINIIFDTEDEEIIALFDKEFTERIIFNLISNSLKYTAAKGEIRVNIINSDKEVHIEIIDNGIGMSSDFIGRAFEMYTMEKQNNSRNVKGTGIGLFVVYNLIRLQGGSIDIESDLGKGSKFTLTFRKG